MGLPYTAALENSERVPGILAKTLSSRSASKWIIA